ncbi:MAG TPA: class I SAM-dependent methyltransferase [Candidatus Limnocylindrales bacterium]
MTSALERRERYREPWRAPFERRLEQLLRPGIRILDVGSGRNPTLPADRRPADCRYVGLDLSAAELDRAPAGSYDERWVADITHHVPELDGRFDLVLSFQVLEHVKPLSAAFENFRGYLRPGGVFLGQFSGTFSFFGLANRVIPDRLTAWLVDRFTDRTADSVFPASYDRCWDSAIRRIARPWADVEVEPRYTGATYLRFLPPVQGAYLLYEDWALRSGKRDLATHYIVEARR